MLLQSQALFELPGPIATGLFDALLGTKCIGCPLSTFVERVCENGPFESHAVYQSESRPHLACRVVEIQVFLFLDKTR